MTRKTADGVVQAATRGYPADIVSILYTYRYRIPQLPPPPPTAALTAKIRCLTRDVNAGRASSPRINKSEPPIGIFDLGLGFRRQLRLRRP
jgi:hypothetical protein